MGGLSGEVWVSGVMEDAGVRGDGALHMCPYVYVCVYSLSGVHSRKFAGVHLCKIKSTSAGSHSDKINRT